MQERSFCVMAEILHDIAFCNREDREPVSLSEGQHSCPTQFRRPHLVELSLKGCLIRMYKSFLSLLLCDLKISGC